MGTYLGLRLGLYEALAAQPATATELAARAGVDRRYACEWLEQQAVAGMLDVEGVEGPSEQRSFRLPPGHREVLVEQASPFHVGPLAFTAGIGGLLPELVTAYRSGEGVPFSAYGADMRDHIEWLNRPMFLNDLGSDWLPAIPQIHERLSSRPPARVLDIACGAGWSSIALALAYADVRVDGVDLDDESIARAKANAAEAGVADRVTFQVRDAADLDPSAGYDAAFVFEALHDLARPAAALAAARAALRPAAPVVVADEKVAERFSAPGSEIDRLM